MKTSLFILLSLFITTGSIQMATAEESKTMTHPAYKLTLLKIPVSNIAVSAKFYGEALEFEQQFVAEQYGWAQFQAGDLSIALYKLGMGGGNRKPGGSVDFHLATANLEKLLERLKRYDPKLKAAIFKNDDGSETLEFADPDGNELKIGRTPK
jgi:predicted enzyme related to lactoylglutathione lyase